MTHGELLAALFLACGLFIADASGSQVKGLDGNMSVSRRDDVMLYIRSNYETWRGWKHSDSLTLGYLSVRQTRIWQVFSCNGDWNNNFPAWHFSVRKFQVLFIVFPDWKWKMLKLHQHVYTISSISSPALMTQQETRRLHYNQPLTSEEITTTVVVVVVDLNVCSICVHGIFKGVYVVQYLLMVDQSTKW